MTKQDKPIRASPIGYGKPPTATRFRAGKSGNPRGKPRGHKHLKTELFDALHQKMWVTENGKRRFLSLQTVFVKGLVADAIKNTSKARDQLLRLLVGFAGSPTAQADDPVGAAKDAEILARFRADVLKTIKEK